MSEYFIIFLAGMAGSFHCIGMCGGFVCQLGGARNKEISTVANHLIYNTGRVSTYVFLGAIAGSLGAAFTGDDLPGFFLGQKALSVVAGVLILIMAARLLGFFHRPASLTGKYLGDSIAVPVQSLLKTPGHGAALSMGVINGFLPCPLVYAFAAKAAASAGVGPGALTMLCFGLGTFPAMLLAGGVGRWLVARRRLSIGWRRWGVWFGAGFLIVLGSVSIARGIFPTWHAPLS